jgi:hypothetical protein
MYLFTEHLAGGPQLMEMILERGNMFKAFKRVRGNKGSRGASTQRISARTCVRPRMIGYLSNESGTHLRRTLVSEINDDAVFRACALAKQPRAKIHLDHDVILETTNAGECRRQNKDKHPWILVPYKLY